jgi:hypothetical protein
MAHRLHVELMPSQLRRLVSRPDIDRFGVGPGQAAGLVVLVIVVALVLGLLIGTRLGGEQRGLGSAEEVGTAYIAAVRSQDREALTRLTRADFEASAAIDEKMQLYRALGERQLTVRYLPPDVTPGVVAAIVEADGLRDQIAIGRSGTRWFLLIGYLRDQSPGPTSTARPPG